MFYSHTYLARKGPLGTVWCAAHLQHKLRKSHYVKTNVPTTVEKIMNPEVPIALRMSGHLLLGVVRIYSKQVDYFYEDCNEIRITINRIFTAVTVNLPSDATHAPYHSVTLPEKFDLDTMELEDYDMDWHEDSHLKSRDEITLTEQIPTGKDPYIIISFDEHDLKASSLMEDTSGSGNMRMEEDDHPRNIMLDASVAGFESPSPSNNLRADGNRSPQDLQSIEVMREPQPGFDFNNSPILPDRAAPDKFLEDQINRDKEMHSPVTEEVVLSDRAAPGKFLEDQINIDEEMHTPGTKEVVFPDARFSSSQNHEERHLDSPMPSDHQSPELELQPTPKPKVKRKRRQPYDTSTVLSNEYIKNTLVDTSDIRRVKRNCPLSSLSIWKRNNRKRLGKEAFFVEPHVTGCSADLQGIYREDSPKNHLATIQETHQETNGEPPSLSRHGNDIEIEVLRNNDSVSPERCMPSFSTHVPSPSRTSHLTPEKSNLRLESEHLERTDGSGTLLTSDVGASGNLDSEIRTPDAFYQNDMQFDNTFHSDIPELVPSGRDLEFLEHDDNSPAGSQRTPEIGTFRGDQSTPELRALSSRARAVAQYLKKQSVAPISGSSEESSEELSLKKILKDKPRKICARLFYEMLVLNHHGLVDVRQEKPYDDIVLKVTSKLSEDQCSG